MSTLDSRENLAECDSLYDQATQRISDLDLDADLADSFLGSIRSAFKRLMDAVLTGISFDDKTLRLLALRSFDPNIGDNLALSYVGSFNQKNVLRDAGRALFLKLRAEQIAIEKARRVVSP